MTKRFVILFIAPLLLAQSECETEPTEPVEIQPDYRFVGDELDVETGARVDGADIDRDGLTDYLISSLKSTVGGVTEAGKVYLVYGSSLNGSERTSLDLSQADATISGLSHNDLIGYELQFTDDINGDGFGDILVASRSYGESGGAYVFFGPLYGDHAVSEADISFIGDPLRVGDLGIDIDSAGDVNGDGFNDLLITAEVGNSGDGAYGGGHAFLIYGPQYGGDILLPYEADATLVTPALLSEGAGAGDVNGDGIDDVILGSQSDGREAKGAAFLFYGPIEPRTYIAEEADATLRGIDGRINCSGGVCLPDGDNAGFFVGPAGDMNQDGFDDVYIAALQASEGETTGAVYLVHGPIYGDQSLKIADVVFSPDYGGLSDVFGFHVESADLNGDGWLDTLLSHTLLQFDVETRSGGTLAWFGPLHGEKTHSNADLFLIGSPEHGEIGLSHATPDQDGDGLPELLIGNPTNFNDPWPGGAYIVNSSTYLQQTAPALLPAAGGQP